MPSDLFTLRPLAFELDKLLSGGKVDKVTQPETDEVRLTIRSNGKNYVLLISANPNAPRIHLTDTKKDNPYTAPAFCMHLRKYLINCSVKKVGILEDRVIFVDLEGKNELKDNSEYRLYVEIMNRYSNVILTNGDGVITDCMKRIGFEDGKRAIMSGLTYNPPQKSDKIDLFDTAKLTKSIGELDEDANVCDWFMKNVNGLAKITATEILSRSGYQNKLDERTVNSIAEASKEAYNVYSSPLFCPAVSVEKPDFFAFPYQSLNLTYNKTATLNEALDLHFSKIDFAVRANDKTKRLVMLTKKHTEKLNKKLISASEKLKECENMEEYLHRGELLMANLYKIKKGDKTVEVDNFYDEAYGKIAIPLDEKLSPQKNVEACFSRYAKLKRAQGIVSKQIEDYSEELDYSASILDELSRASASDEILEIENEMAGINIIKPRKFDKKERKPKPSVPYQTAYLGFTIYVGKNNLQNDNLTFKTACGDDVWLHVKAHHGSHVIIIGGNTAPDEVIAYAAELAAFFSQAASLALVDVDYTVRKNVKRIKGKALGMVNYVNYKTVSAKPDSHGLK